ncbi:MAG: transposase [Nitrosomonas sp.]|nr:transposase [Nitrosomonas sp.]
MVDLARSLPIGYTAFFSCYTSEIIIAFNCTYRTEVLNCYVFETLNEVRRMTKEWRNRYNHERSHESLGRLPPIQFTMAKSQ